MRTNEERTRLIHKRTAEIKRENQKKKQHGLDAVCMAACLLLVVGIGALMPGLMAGIADGAIVGSAIVKIVEKYGENAAQPLFEYVKEMKEAVRNA